MTAVGAPSALRDYSDVEYVFEPHSKTRPPVGEYVRELWARRDFIAALAKSDLRGPNKNTFMGELWNILDPLIQAAIYLMLFILIRGGKPGASATQTATMIISGVFLFNFTRAAIQGGSQSILKSKGLILNSTFPLGILPVAALYVGLLEFLPSLGIYVLIHLALGNPVSSGVFVFPLLFVLQGVMGLGIAFLCATATVYVRDMVNLVNYILRMLLYVTPVIYPVSALTPTLRTILSVNPLFPLFSAYQAIVLGGVPTAGQVFATAAWALFFLVIGYRVFTSRERAFALRL
jgi:teichoic acid transport system permease protein